MKQTEKKICISISTLFSLLHLRSPESLNGGSQTIGSGIQVEKTHHTEEREEEGNDSQGLAENLHITLKTEKPTGPQ